MTRRVNRRVPLTRLLSQGSRSLLDPDWISPLSCLSFFFHGYSSFYLSRGRLVLDFEMKKSPSIHPSIHLQYPLLLELRLTCMYVMFTVYIYIKKHWKTSKCAWLFEESRPSVVRSITAVNSKKKKTPLLSQHFLPPRPPLPRPGSRAEGRRRALEDRGRGVC